MKSYRLVELFGGGGETPPRQPARATRYSFDNSLLRAVVVLVHN
jgi:hypothetical protein